MPDHLLRPATEKFSFQNTGAIEHLLTGYEGKLGLLDPKKEMLMTEGNLLSERPTNKMFPSYPVRKF